jgi:hydroxymethylpyrimidine/phosphomethylpyrimidine kinase
MSIHTIEDRMEAAKRIYALGAKHVVMKGGHGEEKEELVDLLYDGGSFTSFTSNRFNTKNTHGTGCTFAAAITAELSKGNTVKQAVELSKQFIQAAIEDDLNIGNGHGPTNHWAYQKRQLEKK